MLIPLCLNRRRVARRETGSTAPEEVTPGPPFDMTTPDSIRNIQLKKEENDENGDPTVVWFALFYLKGVCPPGVTIGHIYRGIIPFVALQLLGLVIVFAFPKIVTWLPAMAYGN